MARKKNNTNYDPSPFAQDLAGILLVALAVFILVSNFSSATGLVGLYLIKLSLRTFTGVGIYFLPVFIGFYGTILLFRHEIKELTTRLIGLLMLFLTFIAAIQFYAPNYFTKEVHYKIIQGAGGFLGFILKFALERSIGSVGSYILITAFIFISSLLIFNITVLDVMKTLKTLLTFVPIKGKQQKDTKKTNIPLDPQLPLLKSLPPQKDIISFPLPEFVQETEPQNEFQGTRSVEIKNEFPREDFVEVIDEAEKGESKKEKRSYANYKLPPLNLLDDPSPKDRAKQDKLREATEYRKQLLEETLQNFGVKARVVSINQGPAVTRFELQPDPGVKISKIASLSDDIALNLAAQGVRIEAPVPGKSVIGIEIPNTTITSVKLKEIVKLPEFQKNRSKLFIGLGKDLSGTPVYGDIAKMPHLLIAGTTGSGKSVCVNSLIISLLLRARPDEVKFIMIDPKMVELSVYDNIPHLLAPVVTDPRRAALTLKEWVMREMERRYKKFYDTGARNIDSYNMKAEEKYPRIVVIIDELADLMMVAAAEVETTICRLAQMARATGIHIVIATQRPSVDVITGLIKANIPSRIAFAVATQIDSRVIIDSSGAEKLLGRGDMLYNPIGAMKPTRVQGSFVTDREAEKVIEFIKKQADPEYLEEIASLKLPEGDVEVLSETDSTGRDTLFSSAVKLVVESGVASTSYLQRKMRIGYNRAARLMDEIEAAGIVSKPEGDNKPRRILATPEMLAVLNVK